MTKGGGDMATANLYIINDDKRKLEKNLTVCAHKFSKSAEKGIVEAGGKIEVI